MPDDLNNLGNPQNNLRDWEENNTPHVTPIPPEAGIRDDMFGDNPEKWQLSGEDDEAGGKSPGRPRVPRPETD